MKHDSQCKCPEISADKLHIHLSITDKCGNHCLHCSTNAQIGGKSVSFRKLDKALSEMSKYTKVLYISCEGDPFYYESEGRTIVDVMKLLMKYKFNHISFQSSPPSAERFHLLREMIDSIHKDVFFFPQISFNFYSPRAKEQYLIDAKRTIKEYAKRFKKIHFEIRYDNFSRATSLANVNKELDKILSEIKNIRVTKKSAHIVPLGRGAQLFPNKKEEERFFSTHMTGAPQKPLCENWKARNLMMIDTKGYPQLCYSNVALTTQIRTKKGPNLYKDGFKKIRDFYLRVWQSRKEFLKKNMKKLASGDSYCPLRLFKDVLIVVNNIK
jgi:MoaA/NifB/PqqE/SkfB family radical SAM enzyme